MKNMINPTYLYTGHVLIGQAPPALVLPTLLVWYNNQINQYPSANT